MGAGGEAEPALHVLIADGCDDGGWGRFRIEAIGEGFADHRRAAGCFDDPWSISVYGQGHRLVEIQEFIGVEPLAIDAQSLGRINAARDTGDPLDPAVADRLRPRIADEVHRFAALTGLDVSLWRY